MPTVTLACRLPNGHVLENREGVKVKLNGANYGAILKPYGLTEVDASFWEEWKKNNGPTCKQPSKLLSSGAIFEAKNETEAKAKSKDLGKVGFEKVSQTAEEGVEPVSGQR